ncbi:MAG: TlpA family protein disulfide reductase [Prevotellaceae bacterium]|jgi:thiol-disulfide isomerase/thioredoxin|nr:TlpA family protein disulfide reductase [Prevotellaceae bacterium]
MNINKFLIIIVFCLLLVSCNKEDTVSSILKSTIDTYNKHDIIEYDEIFSDNYGSSRTMNAYFEKVSTDTCIGLRFVVENDYTKIVYNGKELLSIGKENTSFFYLSKNEYELYPVKKPFIPIAGFAGSYPGYTRAFEKIINDTSLLNTMSILPDTTINEFNCWQISMTSKGRILGDTYVIIPDVAFTTLFFIDKKDKILRQEVFSNSLGYTSTHQYINYIFDQQKNNVLWNLSDYADLKKHERFEYKLLEKGAKIPDFKVENLKEGASIDRNFIKGKPTLFFFWNLKCDASKLAVPFINKLAKEYPNLMIVGINNEDDDLDKINEYVKKYNIDYHMVKGSEEIAKIFGCNAWPTFIIFNKQSIVTYSNSGFNEHELEKEILKEL